MENSILIGKDKTECCGCRACANSCPNNAIEFKNDVFGFSYPDIDTEKCINCGLCLSVCDFKKDNVKRNVPIKSFAAVNKDNGILKKSSSGGVFRAIADYVLENSGAVCGCVYDDALMPVHICAEKQEDVGRMMGSKYAQSNVGFIYREIKDRLKNGQMVLFSGTPCQIAALYSVIGNSPREKLFTVDLVCHGVPSSLMFKKYIDYLSKKYNTRINEFNFRSKKHGWQRFTSEFTDEKGRKINIGKFNEFYMPEFTSGNLIRQSCFSCKYASPERVGDFTIGDFWGHEKVRLPFSVNNGLSMCTINTERAQRILKKLEQKLDLYEVDYQILVKGNTCLHEPTAKGKRWQQYMSALEEGKIPEIADEYIKTNKRTIVRSKIRQYVPLWLFKIVRNYKYRSSK